MNKKYLVLIGSVVACLITFPILFSNLEYSEQTLVASMQETKKEKEKIEELLSKVPHELNEYGNIGLSFSFEEQLLTVQVKDQELINEHEKKMKVIIDDIAKEVKLDGMKVKFDTLDKFDNISAEEEKLNDLSNEVSTIASEIISEKGYKINAWVIEPRSPSPYIEMMIDGTIEYNDDIKNEIRNLVRDAVYSKTSIKFEVKVSSKSGNDIRDEKWQPIFTAIHEETDKKFAEYRGFAYSFHPEPLEVIIKTDIKPKWFWNSNKKIEEIEAYVHEIIKLKREELSIDEIPYEIIVRGKDNKQIN